MVVGEEVEAEGVEVVAEVKFGCDNNKKITFYDIS